MIFGDSMKSRNVVVSKAKYTPAPLEPIEIVERKGLGHPDTMIDGIMESVSQELGKVYLDEFGQILHHNVDKGIVCGGKTHVEFGGGEFLEPIYILLSGRATEEVDGKYIPVQHIAIDAAKRYLKKIRNLDVNLDVIIDTKISQGSKDLVDLFMRSKSMPFANDTSFGTGYAPFDDTENLCLGIEKYLNSPDYKQSHPYVGEDIKVMGRRQEDVIHLTIACAFVSKYVKDTSDYMSKKEQVKKDIYNKSKQITDKEVKIYMNTADNPEKDSVYITLTGTSAEMGDDGEVGRGNRVNGLITPYRSMSLEAAAGKNPVSHVGKLYSVLAFKIAKEIVEESKDDIVDTSVTLLSSIGNPIDEPQVASIGIISDKFDSLKSKAQYIADKNLEDIQEITEGIIKGKYSIY